MFTRTKHEANRLVKQLAQVGIEAAAIHGNRPKSRRAMNGFRSGEIPILVSFDIASQGSTWMASPASSYDLPNEPESYVPDR